VIQTARAGTPSLDALARSERTRRIVHRLILPKQRKTPAKFAYDSTGISLERWGRQVLDGPIHVATFTILKNWILIVEDHADTLEALVEVLNGSGFAARGASSVEKALQLMKETLPALVLSDFVLKGATGSDLLDQALSLFGTATPPFVFMTAMPVSHVKVRTPVKILKKPLGIDTLLNTVRRYCGRSSENTPGPL
jgi:CheY-like chemotaxis protein